MSDRKAPNLTGKTVIVTGANTGIGKVTAAALATMGARVLLVCRSRERGAAALAELQAETQSDAFELFLADMGSMASIREGAARIRDSHDRIDALVNNAGLVLSERQTSADGHEATFAINHLGYFLFTHELLDLLIRAAPSRIVSVSSEAHRIGDIDLDDLNFERRGYSAMRVYGTTKLMNILFARELARRLAARGVAVTSNSLHPGTIASQFGREGPWFIRAFYKVLGWAVKSPEQGARTSIFLASDPSVEGVSGRYYSDCKPKTPSRAARNDELAARLWAVSEQLCGLAQAG